MVYNLLSKLINFDINLFLFLNGFHSEFWDKIMLFISGKYSWIPLYLFIVFLIFRKFKIRKSLLIILSIIVIITLSDQTSVYLFKYIFLRFRPCYNPAISDIVHTVYMPGGKYGFISSHASNSFALAFFTSLLFKNKYYSILIFIWAVLIAYSRIYLGVHYPADVFFGAIWGVFLAFLIYRITKNLIRKE